MVWTQFLHLGEIIYSVIEKKKSIFVDTHITRLNIFFLLKTINIHFLN